MARRLIDAIILEIVLRITTQGGRYARALANLCTSPLLRIARKTIMVRSTIEEGLRMIHAHLPLETMPTNYGEPKGTPYTHRRGPPAHGRSTRHMRYYSTGDTVLHEKHPKVRSYPWGRTRQTAKSRSHPRSWCLIKGTSFCSNTVQLARSGMTTAILRAIRVLIQLQPKRPHLYPP